VFFTQAKVCEADVAVGVREHVFGLEVTVDEAMLVQAFQRH
jgi:hypothetical protein